MPSLGTVGKGAGGEIQLTDAMAALIGRQPFHGLTFDGERHDCGDASRLRHRQPRSRRSPATTSRPPFALSSPDRAIDRRRARRRRRAGPARSATRRPSLIQGPGFVWVHVEGPDEHDLRGSSRATADIPDVAANALIATETRPRCDRIERWRHPQPARPRRLRSRRYRSAGFDPALGSRRRKVVIAHAAVRIACDGDGRWRKMESGPHPRLRRSRRRLRLGDQHSARPRGRRARRHARRR